MKKLLIFFFVILLIGCNKLDSGIVVDKEFVPAHTERYYIMIGKVLTPQTRRVPEKWYITIEGEHNNRIKREKNSISKSDYESINIGDFITWSKYER